MQTSQKFIAHYRVSTDLQGQSGLGLDAQHTAVMSHITGHSELIAEFTEIESGKKIDRPQLAAFAEHEREQISKPTKEALAAKVRVTRLGNPRPATSLLLGRSTISKNATTRLTQIKPAITELHNQGLSSRAIAKELNQRGILTTRGKQWMSATVCNELKTIR